MECSSEPAEESFVLPRLRQALVRTAQVFVFPLEVNKDPAIYLSLGSALAPRSSRLVAMLLAM